MAKNYSNKGNPLHRYGLTQHARMLKALDPDYVQLDDRKIEHLISYASEFAAAIPFYNKDNAPDGTWEDLFLSDISTVLARVISTRTDLLNADFEATLKQFKLASKYEEKAQYFKALGKIIFSIPKNFNLWLEQIQNTNIPIKKFESNVEGEFMNIIIEKVAPLAKMLNHYGIVANKELKINLGFDFGDFSTLWDVKDDGSMDEENIYYGNDNQEKLETASLKFRLIFKELHHVLIYSINHLKLYFDKSLWNKSNHSPEMGLYISFLKLFNFIQKDYNEFSSRFLRTYYSTILQQQKIDATADKVFVSLGLGKSYDSFNLKKDVVFSAGYDDYSEEILFKNTRDTYLSNVALEDIKSVYLSRSDTAGKNTNYEIINDVYATSSNHLIQDINDDIPLEKLPRIPLFGEEQEHKSEDISNMDKGEIGFAISSPLFYMEEGNREINLSLTFQEESSITFKRLFLDLCESTYISEGNRTIHYEEIFYIIFNNNDDRRAKNFRIYYSSTDSWVEIPPKSISIGTSQNPDDWKYDGNINNSENLKALNQFKIKLNVDSSLAPIISFSNEIDENSPFNTHLPVMKFVFCSDSQPFAYSFLKNLQLNTVNIHTKVDNLSNIDLYSDLGLIDTRYPFKAFGNEPYNGASFVFNHTELFQKHIYELVLKIKWNNFPETVKEFKKYFKGYNRGFSPSSYNFKLSVLKDGEFIQINHENAEISKNIFSLDDDESSLSDEALLKDFLIQLELDPNHSNINVEEDETEDEVYTIDSKNGYIKIELSGPEEMFGHEMYQELYAQVMSYNAQNDEKQPIPKKPLTPIVKSFSISYQSKFEFSKSRSGSSDTGFNFYHLHPYGLDKTIVDSYVRNEAFLPDYNKDGYLFIGFTNIILPEPISLWFQLVPNSHSFWNAEPPRINWRYLSNNQWKDFDEQDILYDGTDNFTKSGIIQLNIPTDISNRNTIFENGKYWIQANAVGNLELFCDVVKIIPNAIELERVIKHDSVFESMPPKSIINIVDKIPQIKSIYQPFASFSGKSYESDSQFFCRISELVNHKNYAITHRDIERLVLGTFPEVFQVKAISDLSNPEEENKYLNLLDRNKNKDAKLTPYQESILKFWREGVLLVVIPNMKNVIHKAFPRFNYKYLQQVNRYLEKKITPFARCKVINPQLEYIRVICSVKFVDGQNNGLSIQNLKKDINQLYCSLVV